MNRGVLLKTLREVWLATLLFGLGLFVFEALLAFVFPTFFDEMAGPLLNLPFFRNILRALLGAEIGDSLGPKVLGSLAWVHPIALVIVAGHEIVFCTRVPAGEVDRGTMDVLLALPVSRWEMYFSETALWLGTGVVVLLMGLAGCLLGGLTVAPENRTEISLLVIIVANLFCLYLAVGGLAFLVSTLSERRGRAIAVLFALVLSSYFLNVLAQYWDFAEKIAFLSVLHYYKPFAIMQDSTWPVKDILILAGCGAVLWTAGGIVFARRDICTS